MRQRLNLLVKLVPLFTTISLMWQLVTVYLTLVSLQTNRDPGLSSGYNAANVWPHNSLTLIMFTGFWKIISNFGILPFFEWTGAKPKLGYHSLIYFSWSIVLNTVTGIIEMLYIYEFLRTGSSEHCAASLPCCVDVNIKILTWCTRYHSYDRDTFVWSHSNNWTKLYVLTRIRCHAVVFKYSLQT